MATTSEGEDTITTESDIGILSGKKILQYPIGLGSSAVDSYGEDVQYMMIKINTDEKTTPLRDDSSIGDVLVTSARQGTGVEGGQIISAKNNDPDLIIKYGEDAVNKERWLKQKGMTRLDKVIILPMPNDHNMKTAVMYEDIDQTLLTKAGDFLNNSAAGNASDLWSLAKNAGIAALVNSVKSGATSKNALLAEERKAVNPKKEIMYKSFDFRSFNFTYMFAPKSERESMVVNEIIETLRYYSLPELTAGKLFYIFPSEFEISFMLGQKDNPNIPRITTSVLRSVNINYSPSSVWATLPNGSPVALTMTLDFLELEMIDRKRVFDKESQITSGF